jgi:hypothetical protein
MLACTTLSETAYFRMKGMIRKSSAKRNGVEMRSRHDTTASPRDYLRPTLKLSLRACFLGHSSRELAGLSRSDFCS